MKKVILTSTFALLIAASSFAQKGGLVFQKEVQEQTHKFSKPIGPTQHFAGQELIMFLMENRMCGILANYVNFINGGSTSKVIALNPAIRNRPQDIK